MLQLVKMKGLNACLNACRHLGGKLPNPHRNQAAPEPRRSAFLCAWPCLDCWDVWSPCGRRGEVAEGPQRLLATCKEFPGWCHIRNGLYERVPRGPRRRRDREWGGRSLLFTKAQAGGAAIITRPRRSPGLATQNRAMPCRMS